MQKDIIDKFKNSDISFLTCLFDKTTTDEQNETIGIISLYLLFDCYDEHDKLKEQIRKRIYVQKYYDFIEQIFNSEIDSNIKLKFFTSLTFIWRMNRITEIDFFPNYIHKLLCQYKCFNENVVDIIHKHIIEIYLSIDDFDIFENIIKEKCNHENYIQIMKKLMLSKMTGGRVFWQCMNYVEKNYTAFDEFNRENDSNVLLYWLFSTAQNYALRYSISEEYYAKFFKCCDLLTTNRKLNDYDSELIELFNFGNIDK